MTTITIAYNTDKKLSAVLHNGSPVTLWSDNLQSTYSEAERIYQNTTEPKELTLWVGGNRYATACQLKTAVIVS